MPVATVRIYKLFAFDVDVEETKDRLDAVNCAEAILKDVPILELFDKFDGQEIFDKSIDALVTHFDGKDEFEQE